MKHKIKPLIVLVCCLIATPSFALEVQDLSDDGHKVWLVEDHHVPIVNIALTFTNAGYANDPKELQGRANLLASMLSEGTTQKDALAFRRALEDKAIELSFSAGRDLFTVQMKTLSENADVAVALMTEALHNPAYDEARFVEVKRRMIAAQKRQQESPNYLAARAWAKLAYGDHPYAQDAIGNKGTVQALSIDDLKVFHDKYLTQDNLNIALVGSMSESQAKGWVKKLTKPLSKRYGGAEIADVEIAKTGKWQAIELDVPQSVVQFGIAGLKRDDPRFYAAYVANYVIGGGGLTSRLAQSIRQERGLSYYVGMNLQNAIHSHGWVGNFASRSDQAQEALDVLQQTLSEIVEQGVSAEEVASAIGYITGSFPLNIDSNGAILNYLVSMQLYNLGTDYLDKRNDLFRAVTLEQVNAVIREMIDTKHFIIVKVGQNISAKKD